MAVDQLGKKMHATHFTRSRQEKAVEMISIMKQMNIIEIVRNLILNYVKIVHSFKRQLSVLGRPKIIDQHRTFLVRA